MKKNYLVILIVFILFAFGLTACDSNSSIDDNKNSNLNPSTSTDEKNDSTDTTSDKENFFIVTFKDYDGTILQTSNVKEGEVPSYNKSNPTRTNDNNYKYTFTGWTPSIVNASANREYIATYSKTPLSYYEIVFKDYDGTVLQTSNVKEGEVPSYNKSNPTRVNDDNYSYTFNSWEPTITAASKNEVYIAKYTQQILPYSITIELDGGTSTQEKLKFKTDKFSKDMLPFDVKRPGYAFKGFELNNVKVYDENGNAISDYQLSATMTFKAVYEESVVLSINYSLYNPKTNELIGTYDSCVTDFGNVSKTKSYKYNTYVDLFANPKEGYTFVGWYLDNQPLSNISDYNHMMWDEDVTIEARFTYTLYDFKVWSNNPNLGQVIINNGNSQTFYDEETSQKYFTEKVTIVAYSKTNIRFLGWYDKNNKLVSTNPSYTFSMLNIDYVLEAKWNYFNIEYDLNDGTNDSTNPTYYDIDMANITLKEPTKYGYVFDGWYLNDELITQIDTSNMCHIVIDAKWTYYTLTTKKNNDNAGVIDQYNKIRIVSGENMTITAKTCEGYEFLGWYDGDTKLTKELTYTFTIPNKSIVYEAKWSVLEELEYFEFTSTISSNSIVIKGLIDKNTKNIVVPDYVTTINEYAFSNCSLLETAALPSNSRYVKISKGLFYGCTSLKSVSIPSTVTTIDSYAFGGCSSLKRIDIPNTVIAINYCAFQESGLEEVTLPYNSIYKIIGERLFYGCTLLKSVSIPNTITTIDKYAFHSCSSLKTIDIPDNVTVINMSAFEESGIENIELPSGLTYIDSEVFKACHFLKTVVINNKVRTIYPQAFEECIALENIVIPDSVTEIDEQVFESCTSLKTITLSKNLGRLEDYAFKNCTALEKITLPKALTVIYDRAFECCDNITVYYEGKKEDWEKLSIYAMASIDKIICSDGEIILEKF